MHLGHHLKLVAAPVVKDDQLVRQLNHSRRAKDFDFRVIDASDKGYGRLSPELIRSVETLYQREGILLDPLYNGKAYSVAQALAEAGESVHLLHTGGVQGWRGFANRGLLAPYPVLTQAVANMRSTLTEN